MARMHARTKGKSGSTHPMREKHPEWSSLNPREIEGRILELAKSEKSTSEIGMILRDQYAVPDVKIATGKTVSQILAQNKIVPELPEDLQSLIKTALKLKKHIDHHKKDLKMTWDEFKNNDFKELPFQTHNQNKRILFAMPELKS